MNSRANGTMEQKLRKLSFEELQQLHDNLNQTQGIPGCPVTVLLDDIRSLHNVGSIFRSADGAHVEQLFLCGITGTPPRNEIRKTSLGAEESIPWTYYKNAVEAIHKLKANGYQIIALEQTTHSFDYSSVEYRFPLCLIIGHEFNGIQDHLLELVDYAVDIPMYGIKQSLNVSVAFGIAIYEIVAQFYKKMEKQL
jgi:tRNA G18 (ribose-2'-O)-methylase SpoU